MKEGLIIEDVNKLIVNNCRIILNVKIKKFFNDLKVWCNYY